MPLLYAEGGQNACFRLQEAIMADSSDQSIFAWGGPNDNLLVGALAASTECFATNHIPGYSAALGNNDRCIVPLDRFKPTYAMTNRGLEIRLPLLPHKHPKNSPGHWVLGVLE